MDNVMAPQAITRSADHRYTYEAARRRLLRGRIGTTNQEFDWLVDDVVAAIRAEVRDEYVAAVEFWQGRAEAGTLDVERLNGDEALGDCLHAAVHPSHPWSGCSNPDLVYTWVTRFRAEYARLAKADRE